MPQKPQTCTSVTAFLHRLWTQILLVQKHKQRLWVSWVVDSIPGVLRTPATEVVA